MRKNLPWLIGLMILFCALADVNASKARLIILADMGNEPDEEQQIVQLLMYSNELEIEGLIAVTGKYLRPDHPQPRRRVLYPELFHNLINGYEQVLPNLKKHAGGWPEADYLRSIVVTGQTGYGMKATGKGKSSAGSELILKSLTKDDPRPVYVVVNAGSNTLAQALMDYQAAHSKEQLAAIIKKLRVYENGAQDNAGAWICSAFGAIHWIRSNYQTYSYAGPSGEAQKGTLNSSNNLGPHTWQPYAYSAVGQHQWALENIIANHGPLGKLYPLRQGHSGAITYLDGGGIIPWLGLIHRGLSDIDHPHWGGWSGRYTSEKFKNVYSKHEDIRVDEEKYDDFYMYTDAADRWTDPETDITYNNDFTPVWRWRRAMFNSIQCRMDWCVKPYEKANHYPAAFVSGNGSETIVQMNVNPGQTIDLDASGSKDPDGDTLSFLWFVYPQAGTYKGNLEIADKNASVTQLTIPDDAAGSEIHVILEVRDNSPIAALSDYRRLVFMVDE